MSDSTLCVAGKPAGQGFTGTAKWYVVMTQPCNEEGALRNLTRQGFDAFLPRRWVTKRRPDRFCTLLEPLFPRYLFVRLDLELQRWRSINGTYGVRRLVGFRRATNPPSV